MSFLKRMIQSLKARSRGMAAAPGFTPPSGGGGGGTPGGSNTQIQFNNAGAFGGSSSLIWNGTSLSAGSIISAGNVDINSAVRFQQNQSGVLDLYNANGQGTGLKLINQTTPGINRTDASLFYVASGIMKVIQGDGTDSIVIDGASVQTIAGKKSLSTPINFKNYTVATLPTGVRGDMAYVTDALTPAYLTTVVGGGAIVTPVFYDGTNWVAH